MYLYFPRGPRYDEVPKKCGKEVLVLARGPRTAREVRMFGGGNFGDFVRLEKYIRFDFHKNK